MRRWLAIAVAIGVCGSSRWVAADPHRWMDDTTVQLVDTVVAGDRIVVDARSMLYLSGYLYVGLTATVHRRRGPVRTTLLHQGPTMCHAAKAVPGGVEVRVCVERYGDTREVTRWRLDRRTGRLVADPPGWRSPYAEAARTIVADLRAGREAQALAALDRLGDSPDGQSTIDWWWSAHRLVAAWPRIARARPAAARARLVPHVERLLAPDDDGAPGLVAALAADLRDVPRCGYRDDAGRDHGFRVAGPRPQLAAMVTRAERLLRGGDAGQVALADALAAARDRAARAGD